VNPDSSAKPGEAQLGYQKAHHPIPQEQELMLHVRALPEGDDTGITDDGAEWLQIGEIAGLRIERAQPVGIRIEPGGDTGANCHRRGRSLRDDA
jgi:hypothetical protein